nr:4'-phosphopantetheinyl transferase superfamily protein [Enterocloster clostridioformis]
MITAFWTMKESIAKAIKTGLMMAMDILEITEIVYSNDKIMGYMKNFSQYKIATYIVDDIVISIAFPKVLDICGLNLNKRS